MTVKRNKHRRLTIPEGTMGLPAKQTLSKGKPNRRVCGFITLNGRDYYLHSTKGYRSVRS